jgi:hypothetical protein
VNEVITFQDILSGGADIAIMIFAYFLWRIDRRVFALELKMEHARPYDCPYLSENHDA